MPQCRDKAVDLSKVETIAAEYGSDRGSLIHVLHLVQEEYGYLPKAVLAKVASCTGVPVAQVYGVTTFFAHFRLKPIGRHLVKVCHGTACHVAGAERITAAILQDLDVEEGEITRDGAYTVERVACLGCCSLAPCMMADEDTHGRLDTAKAKKILKNYS